MARQTQTYAEAVDLNLVVQDALRVLHNQYKHSEVELVTGLEEDLPAIRGNFSNLGQVILNIIKNAFQAVEGEKGQMGKITLSTKYDTKSSSVLFRCIDNGPGIAEDLRLDVFKPFFTTKPVGQGTGLGLYICHEIVQKHGGTIVLEKNEPNGSNVSVRLPV